MRFFLEPMTWILIVAAIASGALLIQPALTRVRGGGIGAAEAVRLMNREKAVVVDVSEPAEYAAAHIAAARNVPLARIDGAPELPKNKALPVILVCATGKRSGKAVKSVQAQGYAKAVSLDGGLAAWRAANLPLESSAAAG